MITACASLSRVHLCHTLSLCIRSDLPCNSHIVLRIHIRVIKLCYPVLAMRPPPACARISCLCKSIEERFSVKPARHPQGSPMADSPAPDVHFEARSANARTRRAATRVIHASRLRSLSGLSIGPIGEDRKVLSNEVRTEEVRQDHALQPHIPPPLVSKEACEIPLRCLIRGLKKRRTNYFARSLVWYSLFLIGLCVTVWRYRGTAWY